jgi:hypothetical protein
MRGLAFDPASGPAVSPTRTPQVTTAALPISSNSGGATQTEGLRHHRNVNSNQSL